MANSKIVEISSDHLRMRAREEPAHWSLKGLEPTTYSTLSVDVPEFVPGKPFKVSGSPAEGKSPAVLSETETAALDSQKVAADTTTSVAEDGKGMTFSNYDTTLVV
jgi:hypothetical protein